MSLTTTISEEDESLLRNVCEAGDYASMDAALSAVIRQASVLADTRRRFDADLDEAFADLEAGRVSTSAEVREELDALIAAKLRKAA